MSKNQRKHYSWNNYNSLEKITIVSGGIIGILTPTLGPALIMKSLNVPDLYNTIITLGINAAYMGKPLYFPAIASSMYGISIAQKAINHFKNKE